MDLLLAIIFIFLVILFFVFIIRKFLNPIIFGTYFPKKKIEMILSNHNLIYLSHSEVKEEDTPFKNRSNEKPFFLLNYYRTVFFKIFCHSNHGKSEKTLWIKFSKSNTPPMIQDKIEYIEM